MTLRRLFTAIVGSSVSLLFIVKPLFLVTTSRLSSFHPIIELFCPLVTAFLFVTDLLLH